MEIRTIGPFLHYFGNVRERTMRVARCIPPDKIDWTSPVVILRLRNMTAIDATGIGAIEDLADRIHASGRSLLLCGAREQPAMLMKQAEFERHVGAENICPSIHDALERASEVYNQRHSSDALTSA